MDVYALRAKMIREWRSWIGRVVDAIKKLIPDAEVYVIGSVARGEAIGCSDIDILVVSPRIPSTLRERAKLRVAIEEYAKLPLYHPLEIHFITPKEKHKYLKRHYIRLA